MATMKKELAPLCDVTILKTKRVLLVEEVIFENVMPSIEPFLVYRQVDLIRSETIKCDKIGRILDILVRFTVAEQYDAFNAFIRSLAGTQPELFQTLCERSPTVSESDFCMNKVGLKVREVIENTKHCTDSDLDEQIDFQYEYVELSIVDKQHECLDQDRQLPHEYNVHLYELQKKNRSISASDVLGTENKQYTKVSIYGRAGIGKSTTLQFWAKQWALGRWAMSFTLLFLLQLRFITTQVIAITTVELLSLYGLYDFPDHADSTTFTSWLKNCASRILILIDGLDEIPGFADRMKNTPRIHDVLQKAHPVDLCINILRGDLLPGCTVISTSRPFAGLSKLPADAKAEILGLTPAKVTEYVERRHPSHVKNIMSVLRKNPILMSLCSITFYCMMITRLLSEGVTVLDEDVKTYTRLMSFIIVQYCSRKITDSSFQMEVSSYFSKLAQLAYSGIFQLEENNGLAKLVFDQDDLVKCNINIQDLDHIKKTGILQVSRRKIGRYETWLVEFFHLSAQELLAVAHFLSSSYSPNPLLQQLFSSGQFNFGLLFIFGLHFDRNNSWIKTVCKAVGCAYLDKNIDSELSLFMNRLTGEGERLIKKAEKLKICQLIHEGQWEAKAKEVSCYIVPNGKFLISCITMTAIDLLAVNFVCSSESINSISLTDINADDSFVNVMLSSLVASNLDMLQVLELDQNNVSDTGATAIATKKIPFLKKLTLSSNRIGDEGANTIANMLESNESLEDLVLSMNNIGEVGAKALAKSLSQNVCLRRFSLSYKHVDGSAIQAVAEMLQLNKCLELLHLTYCDFGDVGLQALSDSLQCNTTLKELRIYSNAIANDGAKSVSEMLHTNTSLQNLDISNNHIGDEGAIAIAQGLSCNTSLKMLNLSLQSMRGCLGDTAALSMASMLHKNTSLVELDISNSMIGDAGAIALAGAFFSTEDAAEVTGWTWCGCLASPCTADTGGDPTHYNTTLRKLDIRGSHVGPDGQNVLTELSQYNTHLEIKV